MNNISFQGKTKFCVSPTAYEKVEDITRQAYTNLKKNNCCNLTNGRVCSLHTDPDCLTVIVRNEKNGFFKFLNINEDIGEAISEISRKTENLKKTARQNPLTAWIVGGTKIEGERGNKIVDTLNSVAEVICDKPDIDTSILVGSKTGEDIFVIRPRVEQLNLSLNQEIKHTNNIESELENMFDVVEINNAELSYMA